MPCGHLYCLSCASFWFNLGDAPQNCSICRKGYRGEDIIKLWLRSDDGLHIQGSDNDVTRVADENLDDPHNARGQQLVDACESALMDLDTRGDDAALATALQKCAFQRVVQLRC